MDAVAGEILTRYKGSTDGPSRFVLAELAPARYAFARSLGEMAARPALGHLMFMRLVAEVGIRLAWIGRDLERQGSAGIRTSIDSVVKRDLGHLKQAIKALNQDATYVEAEISAIPAPAAGNLAEMTAEAPDAANSYAMHRFASALVHAGEGMRSVLGRVPNMEIGLRDSMITCIVLAADLLAELNPVVKPVDVDALLAHDVFAFSPTAVTHRLRRDMRRTFASSTPIITSASMTMHWSGGVEQIDYEIEMIWSGQTFRVSAGGSAPGLAFQNLKEAAQQSVSGRIASASAASAETASDDAPDSGG